MFKKISWIVALIAAFAMVFMGCPEDEKYKGSDFTFELNEAAIVLTPWGDNPTVDAQGFVNITTKEDGSKNTSTGFTIDLKTLVKGYSYNKNAKIIFTYEIDVEVAEACLTVKNGEGWKDTAGDSGYGVGKGREYFLGSSLTGGDVTAPETASNYEGPITVGTYDSATKTGTFEVYMRHLQGLNVIGFQHNCWAEFPSGTTVAEGAKYKVKFTNIKSVLVKEVVLPPEPDPYTLANYNAAFDWTTAGFTVGEVINVGAATDVSDTKPSWDIDDSTDSKFAAVTTGAAVVIKFGDISESQVSYFQIAMQWYDGSGGNGWAQMAQLDGNEIGAFPNIKTDSDWTWDSANKVLKVPLNAAAITYVNGEIAVTETDWVGFCIRFNASGEKNLDVIAVGIFVGEGD